MWSVSSRYLSQHLGVFVRRVLHTISLADGTPELQRLEECRLIGN